MLCISAAIAVMRYPSVSLSVTFVGHVKTNKHISKIFSPSGSHTVLVFPYQTGWRYSDGNPPNGGVECRWGIDRNRDSGLIAGYRRLLDVRTAKCQKQLPCSVDRTVGDAPSNVCLWRPEAWTNTPKRREHERIYFYAMVYLKPKQLIIKDCARRFVLKLDRHEASRGLFATAELLVHWNMAIYRFSKWRPSAILELFYHHTRPPTKSVAGRSCLSNFMSIWYTDLNFAHIWLEMAPNGGFGDFGPLSVIIHHW